MESVRGKSQYKERTYRSQMEPEGLVSYRVALRESDLLISTAEDLSRVARGALERCRAEIEEFISSNPRFSTTLKPYPVPPSAPGIVREMEEAAEVFDVGPMAAVAGAVASAVGHALLDHTAEVIVENGGDLFVAGCGERRVRVFAGEEEILLDLEIPVRPEGIGLCTSSGTVGHSFSTGRADAVTVLADTAEVADAAATAAGNRLKAAADIERTLEYARVFDEIKGIVILVEGNMGAWGDVKVSGVRSAR